MNLQMLLHENKEWYNKLKLFFYLCNKPQTFSVFKWKILLPECNETIQIFNSESSKKVADYLHAATIISFSPVI